MATQTKTAPAYRQRRDYPAHAIVTLTNAKTGKRRDYWLGAFGSRQSKERYHRLLAAWEAGGRALPDQRDDPPLSPLPRRPRPTPRRGAGSHFRYTRG